MSLLQVLKESEIDMLLVGNPQITYFKSVYRRHTPFYKGVYTYGEKPISVGGREIEELSHGSYDLITNIFLENTITGITGNNDVYANIGNNIVENIKFNVGGNALCTVEGLYMEARAELDHSYVPSVNTVTVPPIMTLDGSVLKCNTGSQYNVQTMAGGVTGFNSNASSTDTFYTYPNFYFCRDYGNAFPICALNNSEVELEIHYRDPSDIRGTGIGDLKSTVNVEYVNLSDDERLRFINNTEIYIYYDINNYDIPNGSDKITHPLRQIFFVGENQNDTLTLTTSHSTPALLTITDINIKINSEELYTTSNLSIFTKQNLNRLYPGYGRGLTKSINQPSGNIDSIGVHAFCLDTTNTPSGHLSSNTSFQIILNGTNNTKIYLEVIKFYRIMGGQLGNLYI